MALQLKTEFEYFNKEPILIQVERSFYREYTPVSALQHNAPIVLNIPPAQELNLDLSRSYLYVRARITMADGTNLAANEQVVPVNLSIHSLFSNVDVEMFCSWSVFGLDEVVVEIVHEHLRRLKYGESDIERLVDEDANLPHADADEFLFEDFETQTVRFLHELLCFLLVCDQLDVSSLLHVLAGLAVHCVVHQFEEVFFEVILRLSTQS